MLLLPRGSAFRQKSWNAYRRAAAEEKMAPSALHLRFFDKMPAGYASPRRRRITVADLRRVMRTGVCSRKGHGCENGLSPPGPQL